MYICDIHKICLNQYKVNMHIVVKQFQSHCRYSTHWPDAQAKDQNQCYIGCVSISSECDRQCTFRVGWGSLDLIKSHWVYTLRVGWGSLDWIKSHWVYTLCQCDKSANRCDSNMDSQISFDMSEIGQYTRECTCVLF